MTLQRRRPARAAGSVTTVVIGAGHAGLAMSRCLSERSIDHVVLERFDTASAWRRDRWDSLRLLTPNWQSRLPGHRYAGPDPDGFMSAADVVRFLTRYAGRIQAPVVAGARVTSVRAVAGGYHVTTEAGEWRCRSLVVASGAFEVPMLPLASAAIPASVATFTSKQYRAPSQLPEGGVLVVGASATGLQLAAEIHRSGRPVTLCVGEHVRMPRSYLGRDIQWWMDATGLLDERYDVIDDIERARRVPSPQLVGSRERATLDLNALQALGVRIVGRFAGVRGKDVLFSGSLRNHCALADLKLSRLLDRFDAWSRRVGLIDGAADPERLPPTRVEPTPRLALDITSGEIRSIVWATGFRPDHAWLELPVFDRKGRIRHDGGVVDAPGVYVLGLPFLRRRKSSFIHGAEDDARDLSAHLAAYLGGDKRLLRRLG